MSQTSLGRAAIASVLGAFVFLTPTLSFASHPDFESYLITDKSVYGPDDYITFSLQNNESCPYGDFVLGNFIEDCSEATLYFYDEMDPTFLYLYSTSTPSFPFTISSDNLSLYGLNAIGKRYHLILSSANDCDSTSFSECYATVNAFNPLMPFVRGFQSNSYAVALNPQSLFSRPDDFPLNNGFGIAILSIAPIGFLFSPRIKRTIIKRKKGFFTEARDKALGWLHGVPMKHPHDTFFR